MSALYAHWANCVKGACPESKDGKCIRLKWGYNGDPVDFPDDGKCVDPFYEEYKEEHDRLGAYEAHAIKTNAIIYSKAV